MDWETQWYSALGQVAESTPSVPAADALSVSFAREQQPAELGPILSEDVKQLSSNPESPSLEHPTPTPIPVTIPKRHDDYYPVIFSFEGFEDPLDMEGLKAEHEEPEPPESYSDEEEPQRKHRHRRIQENTAKLFATSLPISIPSAMAKRFHDDSADTKEEVVEPPHKLAARTFVETNVFGDLPSRRLTITSRPRSRTARSHTANLSQHTTAQRTGARHHSGTANSTGGAASGSPSHRNRRPPV